MSHDDGSTGATAEWSAHWFRTAMPYIRAHDRRTFVVMLGSDALVSDSLGGIVHDLAMLSVLGIRLVVVHGAGMDVDGPLSVERFGQVHREANAMRARLEALFTTGIPPSPLRDRYVPTVSGNLVKAQPAGVVGGVDQGRVGKVRRVRQRVVHSLLDRRCVVLLSPIGHSGAGVDYYVAPESLVVQAAADLAADKLIVYHDHSRVTGHGDLTTEALANLRRRMSFDDKTARRLDALAEAGRLGIDRSHLVSFNSDGELLRELFTAEGVGTQVSDGDYRVIRRAVAADVSGVVDLIRPLEDSGALVRRSRERIERDIGDFFVAELDGQLTGCCALLHHGKGLAEVACLVGGDAAGSLLLDAVEAAATNTGVRRLYALTATATEWFAERGFEVASDDQRAALRDPDERNSTVLVKVLAMPADR